MYTREDLGHPPHIHDQSLTGSRERKLLYIIDQLPIRVKKIRSVFAQSFQMKFFSGAQEALEAMQLDPPDVVIADERTLNISSCNIYQAKTETKLLNHISFIILSDHRSGSLPSCDGHGATDYFIRRPIRIKTLLDCVNTSIRQKDEYIPKFPPPQNGNNAIDKIEEFDVLAKAIADNTPINRGQVTSHCNPLIDCIKSKHHKQLLTKLRTYHYPTYVHSMRVAVFMNVFAKAYNFNEAECVLVATGGYLLDIGKTMVPISILNDVSHKNSAEMRNHVFHSTAILSSHEDIDQGIRLISKQHHERLDGSGYPHGLKGNQISELGRMAAIADVFAAQTDRRPQVKPTDAQTAFKKMEQMGDRLLDQNLLSLFKQAILN